MVKALNRVISQQTRLNSREQPFFTPGKELIDALAESAGGDVRSAVNSLQFACSKGVYTKASKLVCVRACVRGQQTVASSVQKGPSGQMRTNEELHLGQGLVFHST